MARKSLSARSTAILSLIARGQSYQQIVNGPDEFTYIDIFNAAKEALELDAPSEDYQQRMANIKEKHTRAYQPWSPAEDADLKAMHERGLSNREIAAKLERQPSAIQSRLVKLKRN